MKNLFERHGENPDENKKEENIESIKEERIAFLSLPVTVQEHFKEMGSRYRNPDDLGTYQPKSITFLELSGGVREYRAYGELTARDQGGRHHKTDKVLVIQAKGDEIIGERTSLRADSR